MEELHAQKIVHDINQTKKLKEILKAWPWIQDFSLSIIYITNSSVYLSQHAFKEFLITLLMQFSCVSSAARVLLSNGQHAYLVNMELASLTGNDTSMYTRQVCCPGRFMTEHYDGSSDLFVCLQVLHLCKCEKEDTKGRKRQIVRRKSVGCASGPQSHASKVQSRPH